MGNWLTQVVGLGRFGFFKFGSIRFSFQCQVLGFGFFSVSVFAHHHNEILTSAGKTSKGSEALEVFIPSSSRMHDQRVRADFSSCKRYVSTLKALAACTPFNETTSHARHRCM